MIIDWWLIGVWWLIDDWLMVDWWFIGDYLIHDDWLMIDTFFLYLSGIFFYFFAIENLVPLKPTQTIFTGKKCGCMSKRRLQNVPKWKKKDHNVETQVLYYGRNTGSNLWSQPLLYVYASLLVASRLFPEKHGERWWPQCVHAARLPGLLCHYTNIQVG